MSHNHSIHNRMDIEASTDCGCFCCCRIFPANLVTEWADSGRTGLCPYCGVDAVIGDVSGITITRHFLVDMFEKWFIV